MQNVGAEQFTYDTFKAAYDTDPSVKPLIKNFDKDGIEPNTKKQAPNNDNDSTEVGDKGTDDVSTMAKRATDVGAKL
jgi:hypothetical protein